MKNEFVPYEQALALKKLGFDEPCFGYYDKYFLSELRGLKKYDRKYFDYQYFIDTLGFNDSINNFTLAPLYQQAFRLFREKYFTIGYIVPHNGKHTYHIISNHIKLEMNGFKSHEEAELECLKKLIEIV